MRGGLLNSSRRHAPPVFITIVFVALYVFVLVVIVAMSHNSNKHCCTKIRTISKLSSSLCSLTFFVIYQVIIVFSTGSLLMNQDLEK